MAYTLAELQQEIQDYTQNAETSFVNNIPNFIRNVEDLILQSVDLDVFRKAGTLTTSSGNRLLAKPADYMSTLSFAITVSGEKVFLLQKNVDFLMEYAPGTAFNVPKFYAQYDVSNFLLAPTPNSNYSVDLQYFYRPASLADGGSSGTTWLSVNAPMAMLYGCLVEAYGFMKGEQDVMAHYKELFGIALNRLKDFGEAKENTDSYRMGIPLRVRT